MSHLWQLPGRERLEWSWSQKSEWLFGNSTWNGGVPSQVYSHPQQIATAFLSESAQDVTRLCHVMCACLSTSELAISLRLIVFLWTLTIAFFAYRVYCIVNQTTPHFPVNHDWPPYFFYSLRWSVALDILYIECTAWLYSACLIMHPSYVNLRICSLRWLL